MQGMTVDEGTSHLTTQNVLFCIDGQFFVKLDSTAMYIHQPPCSADCMDFMFQIFHVFNVHYAAELDLVLKLLKSNMSARGYSHAV